jgi:hypothetical protein
LIARAWKRIVQTHEVSRDAMAKLVASAQTVGFLRNVPDLARLSAEVAITLAPLLVAYPPRRTFGRQRPKTLIST